jgi:hypothetical protein
LRHRKLLDVRRTIYLFQQLTHLNTADHK